nr:MAG TPA: hypothetical protein [Microviridae sp.]
MSTIRPLCRNCSPALSRACMHPFSMQKARHT